MKKLCFIKECSRFKEPVVIVIITFLKLSTSLKKTGLPFKNKKKKKKKKGTRN